MIRNACVGMGLALLLAACSPRSGELEQTVAAPTSTDAPQSTATSRQVMLGLTIPASEVVWGVGSKAPESDADWDRVAANAVMLAESGLMLMSGPRDLKQAEWTQYASDMVRHAGTAAEAAQKRDVDALLAAGDEIYTSCDTCHNKYMPAKVAAPPPG
jgi:hypothetical protein